MTARVLIAEDEPPARAKIRRLLSEDPRFEVAGEARDGVEAIRMIEELRPDLVFLDIQMPGLDGFEALDALGASREFVVIFSTAHDEHALRAFDAQALDYLLKPYDKLRFHAALEKAARHIAGTRRELGVVAQERRLVLRTENGLVALPEESVDRVSASGKHVVLHTKEGQRRVRRTLAELGAKLDASRFVRVHRGEIVRVDAVVRYEPGARGDGILTLSDGTAVVLSRSFRREFSERFRGKG
ncbi:MAG TPA: LytTR family DNA-binding domain-containing protein [Polyangiaceae bacterium]|nr:LytTR family DNA-binding domain-containing protein [Polyangiaceae bacterium]